MSVAVLDVEVPAHRDRSVDIEDRMRDVAGVVNLAHAQLVELVAEAIETGAWQVNGIRTPAHWVSWQAGLSTGHAHEIVRLAEALVTHPAVMSTFAGGAISVDQAAAATNTPSYLDDRFADLATVSTVSQLKVMARAARPAPPSPTPPTPDAPARGPQPVPESFAGWFDDEGRYHLRGELDPDHGRLLDAALREARDALFHAGRSGVTWADALVELAQRSLDATTPATRRDRFRVSWFVDPTDPVPARWADGLAVPAWLVDLLSCDGTVAPVYTAGARPFSVGTSVATIPDRTRRYVLFRDQKCRVPWCPQHQWLQVHHVTHRADHGAHDTANLAALCPACHRAHHRGELGITGNADQPDGLTFTDRHGHPIDPTTRPTPPTRPPPRPAEPYVHPLGERLDHWAVIFPDPPPDPTTN